MFRRDLALQRDLMPGAAHSWNLCATRSREISSKIWIGMPRSRSKCTQSRPFCWFYFPNAP